MDILGILKMFGLNNPDDILKILDVSASKMTDEQCLEIEETIVIVEQFVSKVRNRIEKAKHGRDKANGHATIDSRASQGDNCRRDQIQSGL